MCSEKLHLTETSLSGLRRSGLLCSVGWWLITNVSAFHSPRVKQFERSQQLNCFTLDNGNDALSRNVGTQSTINPRCTISHKIENLDYVAAED